MMTKETKPLIMPQAVDAPYKIPMEARSLWRLTSTLPTTMALIEIKTEETLVKGM